MGNDKNEERDDQRQDQQQGQSQGKKNKILEYIFVPGEDVAIFQLNYQHPTVEAFLGQCPGGYFMASNGVRVALGILHPEWKESKNIIYLDGTNGAKLGHVDITRFPEDGRVYRDNKMRMFNQALEELAAAIKEVFAEAFVIKERSSVKRITL